MTTLFHSRHGLLHRLGIVFALATACVMPPALASGFENPTDSAAVRAVKLDMELVKRLDGVVAAIAEIDDVPPLFLQTKANKVPKTLPELEAELRTSTELQAAIAAQGFTPREYLLTAMAWGNAWIGYARVKEGDADAKNAASAEQMAFVEQHFAELKALQQND